MGVDLSSTDDVALQDAARVKLPEGAKVTPMMRQWLEAKARAPEAVLLFRMGDFYELFHSDAELAAPILDLVVTSRDKKKGGESIAMAGFPHHAASQYIARLIAAGHKVAVCDQLEDPALAKGIVKRGVTRVVTPGMVLDEDGLEERAPNHLVGVVATGRGSYGIAALDLSTGRFTVTRASAARLIDELARLVPAELVVENKDDETLGEFLASTQAPRRVEVRATQTSDLSLLDQLGPLDRLLDESKHKISRAAAALVLSYVADAQGAIPAHVRAPAPYAVEKSLMVDATTRAHLELTGPPGDLRSTTSLLGAIDKTCTALGGRTLLNWMLAPSGELEVIARRHDAVDALLLETELRGAVRTALKGVYDVERLCARLASGRAGPSELQRLRASLSRFKPVIDALNVSKLAALEPFLEGAEDLSDLSALLESALDDDPKNLGEGTVIRAGYDKELDDTRDLATGGRDRILQMEATERERTGIPNLKVKYTRVFGYYLEVTKTHLKKVPDDYRRKQTVANAERFVTEALSDLENAVASAEQRLLHKERAVFDALKKSVSDEVDRLLRTARALADLDVLCAFAELASARRYVRPEMLPARVCRVELDSARHPVVEVALEAQGESFVPADLRLDQERQLVLVTGPNMAGKSTLLRQVALCQILAQMGSFVPATRASMSLADRVFTRVGANDDLAGGRSTFMVEMTETAHILAHATKTSLVLLDEIGRGTSTFDGVSLAWAACEHLHDEVGARTMFATHYHELCELSETLPRLANVHVVVKEWNDKIVFTRTLADGPAERSYGIQVARLAGLPAGVLARAREVLAGLEGTAIESADPTRSIPRLKSRGRQRRPQMDLFTGTEAIARDPRREFLDEIAEVDVNRTNPVEAMNILAALVDRARKLG